MKSQQCENFLQGRTSLPTWEDVTEPVDSDPASGRVRGSLGFVFWGGVSMAEVVLFHSVLGLRPGVKDAAERLICSFEF
jgi:hypothetical protein